MLSDVASEDSRVKTFAYILFVSLAAAAFIGITAWQLVYIGPFGWHIRQPQSVQGGIEALTMISLLVVCQLLGSVRIRWLAVFVIGELYLRRHGVDFALLIDTAYLEVLIALGGCLMRAIRKQGPQQVLDYLQCYVLGLLVWSLFAWLASALGLGTLRGLRILTVVLGVAVALSRPKLISQFIVGQVNRAPIFTRILGMVLLGWIFVLFAKTNISHSYDSLWYGLRGEHVLVGNATAYQSLGLAAVVHYYPKLYELLLIPVSGLGNSGVISGMTLMIYALLALTCNLLLRQLGVTSSSFRAATAIACVTIPAISNSSIDPKPDLLSHFLLVLGWLHASQFISGKKIAPALWTLSCLLLSVQAKLTAIPYAAAIGLATILVLLYQSISDRPTNRSSKVLPLAHMGESVPRTRLAYPSRSLDGATPTENWLGCSALVLAITVSAFVTARTVLLAGMPTIAPDQLLHLWQRLGFALSPPVQSLLWFTKPVPWDDTFALATDLLFRPQVLGHTVIYWTGNIWLWLGIVVLVGKSTRAMATSSAAEVAQLRAFKVGGAAVVATGLFLMFGVAFGTRGSDGNYYISAIVAVVLMTSAAAWRIFHRNTLITGCLIVCLGFFVLFQTWYGFLSASWAPGTHAWDWKFGRGFHQYRKRNHTLLAIHDLSDIEYHLRKLGHSARVVTCMDFELSTRLPARTEDITQILGGNSNPDTVFEYLSRYNIEYLILERDSESPDKFACKIAPYFAQAANVIAAGDRAISEFSGKEYIMLDITKWHYEEKNTFDKN